MSSRPTLQPLDDALFAPLAAAEAAQVKGGAAATEQPGSTLMLVPVYGLDGNFIGWDYVTD
ncbi:hypothetical protein [Longimicrobium sp.]|uniref:hypothetical protein n=1 Tax=Longimicrobium sp. TaxID=2029185 RepID=UPI002C13757C|nr:hypothetical protein [Longimicrobium sp.]HSU12863.1 hypothetical protein [Longimicrobium sp.]